MSTSSPRPGHRPRHRPAEVVTEVRAGHPHLATVRLNSPGDVDAFLGALT